jgi:hypothetical protein
MWYREAQQGRLNLDTQTGVENFRNELKTLIGKSLVRNKLNPLQFVVDFDELNDLLDNSPLSKYVKGIENISDLHKQFPEHKNSKGMYIQNTKEVLIPKVYNADNYSTFLHEVVHSIDPVLTGTSTNIKQLMAKDDFRPYWNQNQERLANMENLHDFYSDDKLKKVLDVFYIKDKKKYPTQELATRAFMNDLKNYMQNPEQSILLQPSRFHSYMRAVNGKYNTPELLLLNSYKPLTPKEIKTIFGDINPESNEGREIYRKFLRDNPKRTEARDIKYVNQLKKFFSNVYVNTSSKIMPNHSVTVRPFDASKTISLAASKSWLAKLFSKLERVPIDTALHMVDYLTYHKRDLFSKFISTLHKLNIVLDESFNLQDPRWQLLEPIVELILNELIKYSENPKEYKSSVLVDQKAVNKSINPYKAWQELVLSYKEKYKTPDAILAAIRKNNPTITIQIPNFAAGQIFDKPFSMGNQSSKPFNQLDAKIQENIIYMINNNGALPPGNDATPNLNYNKMQELKMQK